MTPSRLSMAAPPTVPDDRSTFAKSGRNTRHQAHHSHHREQKGVYDDDVARRGNWLLVTIVATLLVIGALLIFSGLL
jgi:hypothetical protein